MTGGTFQSVNDEIAKHDQILMMGHGSPGGLFSVGAFYEIGRSYLDFVISANTVELLKGKRCAFIWCHAESFVKRTGLGGFSTGMFISEVAEARYYRIAATQRQVDNSNRAFADIMKDHLFDRFDDGVSAVIEKYRQSDPTCPVVKYNSARLYDIKVSIPPAKEEPIALELLELLGNNDNPLKSDCIIAITETGEGVLIQSIPSLYSNELFDGCILSETLDQRCLDSLPKEIGIYSCAIEVRSSKCNHPEDPTEYDINFSIKSFKKLSCF